MDEVLTELHDGWAEVILNRPERKNAIVGPLGVELERAINKLNVDPDVRLILLRGNEGAFCSGLDLKAFNENPEPDWVKNFQKIWRGAHSALFNCKKPIVGALEKYAINGGAALALSCDLLVSGEEAFIQVGEARIGMAAPYNLAWLSLRYPESVISRITLIGDRIPGKELRRLGLAQRVVADVDVLGEARSLAVELAGFPEDGLRRIKTVMRAAQTLTADEWFDQFTQADPVTGSTKPSKVS